MALIDIFNDDAFSTVELIDALRDTEYLPGELGQMGIFTPRSSRTDSVAIERVLDKLALIPTTLRGSAPTPNEGQERRNIRNFTTPRLANGDRITASEIANIRAFGSETELVQVQEEVATRMAQIRNNLELTKEHMRLGAIQGLVLDADGSVLFNWFNEWGISQPAEKVMNFSTLADGAFRKLCAGIVREMARASQGTWVPGRSRVIAMVGDEFWDAMIANPEVRETYKGWSAAADLRGALGNPWDTFSFGGIDWINYRGTDDNSKVAID